MILFFPMPSSEHMTYYCTFLEMRGKPVSELTLLDDGMPSAESGFGRCPHCPAYVFCLKQKSNIPFKLFHLKPRMASRQPQRVMSCFCTSNCMILREFVARVSVQHTNSALIGK